MALELLDADGIGALSMRRLGSRLGAGATSLYSYVATKDELIELVVDHVYGEIDPPRSVSAADWREITRGTAGELRGMFLRHPWMVSVLGEIGVAYLGPNLIRLTESLLAVYEDAGFTLNAADQAVNTVIAYVVGVSASEAAWLTMINRTGQTEGEWIERLWPAAEAAVHDFPRLRQVYASQHAESSPGTRDAGFEDGLACVLDGVAARRQP